MWTTLPRSICKKTKVEQNMLKTYKKVLIKPLDLDEIGRLDLEEEMSDILSM